MVDTLHTLDKNIGKYRFILHLNLGLINRIIKVREDARNKLQLTV